MRTEHADQRRPNGVLRRLGAAWNTPRHARSTRPFTRKGLGTVTLAAIIPLLVTCLGASASQAASATGGNALASSQSSSAAAGFTVSVGTVTSTSAQVKWTPVAKATGYQVGRDGKDSGGGGPWSTTDPASTTSRVFLHLVPGQKYTFTVTPQGVNVPAKTVSVTMTKSGTSLPNDSVPTTPGGGSSSTSAGSLTVTTGNVTSTSVQVTWTPVPKATGYQVGRDGKDSGGGGPWSTTDPASTTSRVFLHLVPGQKYTFTVTPQGVNAPAATISVTMPKEGTAQSPSAPPPTASPTPSTPSVGNGKRLPELGFSVNGEALSGPLDQKHYNALGQLTPGPVWARMGFSSDGKWQATADTYFYAATKADMKVLLRASFPESQYSGRQQVNVEAYGDFVAAMAARYKGKGVNGSNPVIELPNEINGTKISGATYAAAACNAYPKLKAIDPGYKIIGASENVYASNWKAWLEDVYKAGFAKCSDGVSFHNYDVPGDGSKYKVLRDLMVKYGHQNAMVWLTEFGATTCPGAAGKPLGCQTEQQQADKIVGNLQDLRDNYPWITHAFIYADEEIPPRKQSDPFEAHFGLYRNDARGTVTGEKPAVAAVKRLYR